MVIFALSLVEQVLRNTAADSRWNIKPFALGLIAVFIYDVYLYSDALLFNHIDDDIFGVRGFVYAMIIPLIAMSIQRTAKRRPQLTLFHPRPVPFQLNPSLRCDAPGIRLYRRWRDCRRPRLPRTGLVGQQALRVVFLQHGPHSDESGRCRQVEGLRTEHEH